MTTATDQPRAALALGTQTNIERKHRRLAIKAMGQREARAEIARLVVKPPRELRSLTAAKLLAWCPRIGPAGVVRTLVRARVGEARLVGELTARERRALCEALEERAT